MKSVYNSGIGSNGLTSARHDVLNKTYGERFPESYDNGLDKEVVYIGSHSFSDKVNARRIHSNAILPDTVDLPSANCYYPLPEPMRRY